MYSFFLFLTANDKGLKPLTCQNKNIVKYKGKIAKLKVYKAHIRV